MIRAIGTLGPLKNAVHSAQQFQIHVDSGMVFHSCHAMLGPKEPRISFSVLSGDSYLTARSEQGPLRHLMRHRPTYDFFLPSGPYCWRKLHRSSASFSFLMPGKTIFVPGIFAFGSLMYSLNVASLHTIPEFLLALE